MIQAYLAVLGVLWAAAAVCFALAWADNEPPQTRRKIAVAFWLAPVWPLALVAAVGWGLWRLWIAAWGSPLAWWLARKPSKPPKPPKPPTPPKTTFTEPDNPVQAKTGDGCFENYQPRNRNYREGGWVK